MSKTIYLTDRSAEELDDKCSRAYWWNRIHGERGIVGVVPNIHLKIGAETHEDLRDIAEMDLAQIGAAVEALPDPRAMERADAEIAQRRRGWFAAFASYVEPLTREVYDNHQVEAEIVLDREPLWTMVTPDRVLRHRKGNYLVYREYKTTKRASHQWVQHWPRDIQIHLGLLALEEEIGETPAFGQVMGLVKGDYYTRTDGVPRLSHPYVWAYRRGSEWTHRYEQARAAGWEPAPVWEYPGGTLEWVHRVGREEALEMFPQSAPVMLDRRMVEEWVARRSARHEEIERSRDLCRTDTEMRNLVFPPRTQFCRPSFGDACPYEAACWNVTIGEDPIGSGLYVPRVPHHELELTYEGEE